MIANWTPHPSRNLPESDSDTLTSFLRWYEVHRGQSRSEPGGAASVAAGRGSQRCRVKMMPGNWRLVRCHVSLCKLNDKESGSCA
jgi:hypothetical protein